MANARTSLFGKQHSGGPVVIEDEGRTTGNRFFVDSGSSTNGDTAGFGDNPDSPFATLDFAVSQCTANNGDIIYVMPGHAETKAATGSLFALDVAGIKVIGLGEGNDRPTFTFSHTGASATISAASITLENVLIVAGIDSVTAVLTISAAAVTLRKVEWRDTTDIEFVRGMITTAAADRLLVDDCTYSGYTGGNACVNAIRLVGSDEVVIRNCVFQGKFSTAVIEFETTACTKVVVQGCTILNSGTTDLSKNVVDTVTGSTWAVRDTFDTGAGASFSGGSGAALASDDVSTLASLIGTANVTTSDSLHGKLGTDTEMADRSMYDMLRGLSGVDIPGFGILVSKTGGDPTAAADDLFDVTGLCYVTMIVGRVTTVISGGTDPEIVINVKDGSNTPIAASTVITIDAQDTLYLIGGDPAATFNGGDTPLVGFAGLGGVGRGIGIFDGVTIEMTSGGGGAATGGVIEFFLWYYPLEASASIAAAA